MTGLHVLVVAEDPLARAGIAGLLVGQEGLLVAAQVNFTPELADDIRLYTPDVLLLDLGWDAPRLEEHLNLALEPGLPLVVLAPDTITAEQAWSSGAQGVLPREVDALQLNAALQAVATGLRVTVSGLLAPPGANRAAETSSLVEELTPREHEVLQCLAEGASNKEIARRLAISEHTVKFHINALLGKLGAQSRTEAVVRASRLGLVVL